MEDMTQCCKVGKAIEKYSITPGPVISDTDDYLLARWKGEGEFEAAGIRPLQFWLNKEIIMTVYERNGRTAIQSQVESDHEILEEGDDIEQSELIGDLASDGIDGDQLLKDMISQSTMYRHLKNCLGGEKQTQEPEESSVQSAVDRIEYAVGSPNNSIKKGLKTLENQDAIVNATEAEINLQLKLACPECATQKSIEQALEDGTICDDHMSGEGSNVEKTVTDAINRKKAN